MVTEECYGQLKGRWRILLRKCESSTEEVRAATLACMGLQNVCLERRETMSKKLNLTIDPVTNQSEIERQYGNYFKLNLVEQLETHVIRSMPFGTPFLKNYLQKKRNPLQHISLLTHF